MHDAIHNKVWFAHVAVALVVAGILAAGCGSDDDGNAGNTDSETADLLGPENKATGTPVTIGFVSDGQSAAIDNSAEIDAAEATVSYINDHLGGLGGHPIELLVCETGQTPSGATDCATEMVTAKVPVVVSAVSGQGGTVFNGLLPSNIPFVMLGSIDTDLLTKKGAFIFSNPLGAALAGPAGIAQERGVERAAVVVIDVPDASGPVKAIGDAFYSNAGVELDVVTVPPGTPDMTPQIQAELENDPGQFAVVGDATFCTSALKAIKTLGFDGSLVAIPQCIDDSTKAAVPGGIAGITIVTSTKNDPDDEEFKLYSSVMDTYAEGTDQSGSAQGAYQVVLGLVNALGGITDVTSASVDEALSSMEPTPLPLGGGITLLCDGKQVTITPNACTSSVLSAVYDDDGNPTDFKELDTAEITTLG